MATNHSVWEYDAPQYVDFTQPNEDDNPEEYFGWLFVENRIALRC